MTRFPLSPFWQQRPFDRNQARVLAAALQVPEPIGAILLQRGLGDPETAAAFLAPALGHLPSPFLMRGMKEAVSILAAAVRQQKPVLIYGDYDVDGVTGTAVLALFLKDLGATVHCYQPDRLREGYGLHADVLQELRSRTGAEVLVTVDCGISDQKAVTAAVQAGFTVVVTDHHRPPPTLPPAAAVLNPLQSGCDFPFKSLAGAGVAFYLVMGLRSRLHEEGFWSGQGAPALKSYLDLVAIGTICDLVPLVGPNRIFARAGLEVLAVTGRPGLRAMLNVAGVTGTRISAEDVGFRLGPRLNAAGRLGDARRALDLLLTEDAEVAGQLAGELDGANRDRQQLEKELFEEALAQAAPFAEQDRKGLVLAGEDWHPGILGIVASRMVQRFYRPVFLLSRSGELLKGSGRSIPEFDLYQSLSGCQELLDRFGGHAAAAGVALRPEQLESFRRKFEASARAALGPEDLHPKLLVDWPADQELAGAEFFEHFLRLPPFGNGNPEPVFSQKGCRLSQPRTIGGGAHLRFGWSGDRGVLAGVGFGFGHLVEHLKSVVDLAFTFQLNEFRGRRQWQVKALDIRTQTTP